MLYAYKRSLYNGVAFYASIDQARQANEEDASLDNEPLWTVLSPGELSDLRDGITYLVRERQRWLRYYNDERANNQFSFEVSTVVQILTHILGDKE